MTVRAFCDALGHFAKALSHIEFRDGAVAAALGLILGSDQPVICSGVGKSGFVAAKLAASLNSVGVRAIALNPTDTLHGDLGIVAPGSTVVLISNSGRTAELLNILPSLRQRNCRILSIVGPETAKLAQEADVVLAYGTVVEAEPNNLAPTTSTTVQMAIADAITVAVCVSTGLQSKDFLYNHPAGALGKRLMRVETMMRTGDRLPVVHPQARIVDAIEEMTVKSIGCVCIVDPNDTLLGLITDGDIRRAIRARTDLYSGNVEDLMITTPQVVDPQDVIGMLLGEKTFLGRHFTVPVVQNDRKLVGILVSIDLI